ncbi:glycerophosphoryl diester phosphodiesterase [Paraliobacillus quinghaiensis]|uniref:Glycerophosphoryl diester phosphodiesterase n=1 Tax=Paraliobacillus quinghaiensis TaxID=470815 RepID=A0A917TGG8_9BACI|nr:glycerophosphodiester phosphodiesterase [Paraliobacillus quinghaiensis]GGM22301.1 glycerophosphoryl diester phosphodiesterase [Paraliobacillus quinghaiensis]
MKTIIYAHRGASKLAPENTMPAFELAYEQGADGIETDVQLTKDHIPVLIHDENVRRTTNGTGFVQDYTFKELQKLDAGFWFSRNFVNTPIISLEHFLRWTQEKNLKINLELKTDIIHYKDIELIVYDLLKKYGKLNQTVVSSFNPHTILQLRKIDSNIKTAFLTSQKTVDLFTYTKKFGASGIHIKYRLLTKVFLEKAMANDLFIGCYTINRISQMMRCYKMGCHAIFTDLPNVAIETRELYEQHILQ